MRHVVNSFVLDLEFLSSFWMVKLSKSDTLISLGELYLDVKDTIIDEIKILL